MKFVPTRALIVVGAALALGIGGGVAVAQIPSNDGTITACMLKDGTIRLIDAEAGATCKKSEKLVTWNEQGQPGADGVSGIETSVLTDDWSPGGSNIGSIQTAGGCPRAGMVVTGGGASQTGNAAALIASEPLVVDGVAVGWMARWGMSSGGAFPSDFVLHYSITTICADAN